MAEVLDSLDQAKKVAEEAPVAKAMIEQKILVFKIYGGDAYSVVDPFFDNGEGKPKGRIQHCMTRAQANSLRGKWQRQYAKGTASVEAQEKENEPSKSDQIRELIDKRVPIGEIAKQLGVRYQMVFNVGTKHLKRTGMTDEYKRAVDEAKEKEAATKGMVDGPKAKGTKEAYVS